jgi:hypothetical protein
MDLYDDRFYRSSYSHILYGLGDWEELMDNYQVDYTLIRKVANFGLKSVMDGSKRWKLIYNDEESWIYGRNN